MTHHPERRHSPTSVPDLRRALRESDEERFRLASALGAAPHPAPTTPESPRRSTGFMPVVASLATGVLVAGAFALWHHCSPSSQASAASSAVDLQDVRADVVLEDRGGLANFANGENGNLASLASSANLETTAAEHGEKLQNRAPSASVKFSNRPASRNHSPEDELSVAPRQNPARSRPTLRLPRPRPQHPGEFGRHRPSL